MPDLNRSLNILQLLLSLLQGIVPTQRSNPGLLRCRRILYQLSHKGTPTPNPLPHSQRQEALGTEMWPAFPLYLPSMYQA